MTGARGIMAGIGIGIGTETVIARGIEIGIGEMIVGEMIETAIETVIGIGTGIETDVDMNLLLVAAHLHLIDIVKLRIHLATTVLPLEGHLPQRLKRRNRG
jgi:hypothetical protein